MKGTTPLNHNERINVKLYRNSYADKDGKHLGYFFGGSKDEMAKHATAAKKHGDDVVENAEQLEINPDKKAVIAALNKYAAHANNS